MRGRGERLERATLPDGIFLALANTGTPVPTGAVYRRFDEMGLGGGFAEAPPPDMSDPALFIAALKDRRNDLEAPAFALAPEVARLKAAMAAQPGCALARMSGSGGTIFGLFTDPDAARAAADRLQSQGDADWTASGRLHGENT
jgi:4-diphosphocytidyl-2-C-methyl-D-erythritol kinase